MIRGVKLKLIFIHNLICFVISILYLILVDFYDVRINRLSEDTSFFINVVYYLGYLIILFLVNFRLKTKYAKWGNPYLKLTVFTIAFYVMTVAFSILLMLRFHLMIGGVK